MMTVATRARRWARRMSPEEIALELRLLTMAPTAKARAGLRTLGEPERVALLTEAAARMSGAA